LARDDFELAEQGKAQTIAVFSMESNQKAVGLAEKLPAGTYSNMPVRAGASQNLTAILFDTLNTDITDQANARKEVVRFLQQIQPQDRVAIFGLGTSLRVVHDFTGDSAVLARAIEQYATRLSPDQKASIPAVEDSAWLAQNETEAKVIAAMDAFLNESNQTVSNYYIQRRTAMTLNALTAVADHLAALPGRKCLVWISGGFPFSYGSDNFQVNRANEGIKTSADILSGAARAITNANVAMYPVDARMLISTGRLNATASAEGTLTGSARGPIRTNAQVMDDVLASRNTMQDLADKTGGRAIYDTADVQQAIRRALDDSRVTYTLGYYPADARFDGRFRSIKVSVDRPGVQLKYRRGYYAFPEEPLDDSRRQKALSAAATNLLDTTGVGFSVQVADAAAGSAQRTLSLDVDPGSLKLEEDQDRWTGGLDVLFVQYDAKGNLVANIGRQMPINLSGAEREQLLKDGLVLNAPIEIKPTAERIRVILRDIRTGAVGSVTLPIK
jgi:VWFA-related protein